MARVSRGRVCFKRGVARSAPGDFCSAPRGVCSAPRVARSAPRDFCSAPPTFCSAPRSLCSAPRDIWTIMRPKSRFLRPECGCECPAAFAHSAERTQRKPMWLVVVSLVTGKRAAGR